GISYGSLLGATYANLFPDHVRAMVLDGNINPRAWVNSGSKEERRLPTYLRYGVDLGAAATLDQFLSLCGSTTADRCDFSAGTPHQMQGAPPAPSRASAGHLDLRQDRRHRGREPLQRPPAVGPLGHQVAGSVGASHAAGTPATSGSRAISRIRTD